MKRQRPEGIATCKIIQNVGGKLFQVSQETLAAFGYSHARMVNEQAETNDEIFVNRDPLYFQILLQASRTFQKPQQKDIDAHKQHLLVECEIDCVSNG